MPWMPRIPYKVVLAASMLPGLDLGLQLGFLFEGFPRRWLDLES